METRSNTHGRKPSFIKILFKDFSKQLSIPPNYVRLHGQTLAKTCILHPIHKRGSWPVSTKQIGDQLYFTKGWDVLAQECSLRFGDFLCFRYAGDSEFYVEMYDTTCCLKDVTSSRGEITRDTSHVVTSQKMKVDALTAALINEAEELRLRSNFPSFTVVMQPAYVNVCPYLHVPSDFARIHLKGSTRYVKVKSSGKTWIVKLVIRDGYGWKLTRGWIHVARGKHLDVRDVCVFKLVNTGGDEVLELSVIRRNSEVLCAQKGKKRKFNQPNTESSASDSSIAKNQEQLDIALTLKSRSKNPSQFVSMGAAYLEHGFLHLTSAFMIELHMKDGAHKMKLRHLGKEWDVGFMIARGCGRINKGWCSFVKDNSLQKNDVCFFELINKEDVVMEVTILKYTST